MILRQMFTKNNIEPGNNKHIKEIKTTEVRKRIVFQQNAYWLEITYVYFVDSIIYICILG